MDNQQITNQKNNEEEYEVNENEEDKRIQEKLLQYKKKTNINENTEKNENINKNDDETDELNVFIDEVDDSNTKKVCLENLNNLLKLNLKYKQALLEQLSQIEINLGHNEDVQVN
jgi:hypothetical protein